MQMLRAPEVARKVGVSVVSIWRRAKDDPTFPKPVRISANCTAWVEEEIDDWLGQRVAASRSRQQAEAVTA